MKSKIMKRKTICDLEEIMVEIDLVKATFEILIDRNATLNDDEYTLYELYEKVDYLEGRILIFQKDLKEKTDKIKYFHQVLVDESLWE